MVGYAKNKVGYSLFIIISSLAVTLFYQNCAKLNITDLEAESRALEAERIALGKDDETVVVGVNAVPDLKMFFVVDNSGTMKQNQLNLSDSFGAMFDSSSNDSLSKFDTTAVLISTAQKSPSFSSEKASLDSIVTEQKSYVPGTIYTDSNFSTNMRSALYNFGFLPGDNIGYRLVSTLNPLKYVFSPSPVLGVKSNAGQVSFSSVIRKLASESPSTLETEFKSRLAVLNSDRIPLVLEGGQYKPQHANVVDSESGLCAVARILRNPESTIKAGDLLSFTIVSDENDNDPKGLNCIQEVTEYTGNEDLVDGECRQRETNITYKTTGTVKAPDVCKINGNVSYNYQLKTPTAKITTKITYRNISKAATYQAAYSSLVYKSQATSYQYLNTDITYYTETCVDVISDGTVIGKKCSVNTTPIKDSKAGNFTADCYGLAKSLKSNAINSAGYAPLCTTSYKAIASCSPNTDVNCKATVNYTDKTLTGLIGYLNAQACLDKASAQADYASGSTPTCTNTPKTVASCSAAETTAGCNLLTATEYATKSVVANGDYTRAAPNDCVTYAKAQSGNAVVNPSDVTECTRVDSTVDTIVNNSIKFTDTAAADGGATLAVGTPDCGSIKSLIVAKSGGTAASVCSITGYNKMSEITENFVSDCKTQGDAKCLAQGARDCTSVFVAGTTSSSSSGSLVHKKVQEDIKCTSLCSESTLGACDSNTSNITVADYLKTIYGSTAACTATTTDLATGKESKLAQLASNVANICKPNVTGVPSYFVQTKGPYRTKSVEVDYVAGTVKDADGKSVPAQDLISYIKSRSQALSNGNSIFSALVRTSTDPLGTGGTYGADYEKLIQQTNGRLGSVLSNDYSVALKDLGRVIKENIERTLVLKKMKPTQVIKKVYRLDKSTNQLEVVDARMWTQNGASLVFAAGIDLNDGDQFKVEFQNY